MYDDISINRRGFVFRIKTILMSLTSASLIAVGQMSPLNKALLISSVCAILLWVNAGIFRTQKADSHRQFTKYTMPHLLTFITHIYYVLSCA
jgi:hypothetical protein